MNALKPDFKRPLKIAQPQAARDGVVFQLAHISGDAAFPEPVGDPLHIDNEWAMHQVQTTTDFAPRNRLLNWYIGGLNYQIEHHLFPIMPRPNFKRAQAIIRPFCLARGLTYEEMDPWASYRAAYDELRRVGLAAA